MKFFVDTANVEDIRKANDMGVICGVTTNPSLIAKEGRVFEEVIAEITKKKMVSLLEAYSINIHNDENLAEVLGVTLVLNQILKNGKKKLLKKL